MGTIKSAARTIVPQKIWRKLWEIKRKIGMAATFHKVHKKYECRIRDKIRIVFIVQRTEVFNSVRTVFEEAVRNDRCEVYVLPLPRCVNTEAAQELQMHTLPAVQAFCKELEGAAIIDSYDEATDSFYDLEQLKPDYIFLNVPYANQYPAAYSMEKLAAVGKICFVPYAYSLGNIKKYPNVYKVEFSDSLLSHASYLFLDGEATYQHCRKELWLSEWIDGKRRFKLGYPRFDRVNLESTPHEKFTALWLPRWTTNKQHDNFTSSFWNLKDTITDFFAERQDSCALITRPHPLTFENHIKDGLMTTEDVTAYKNRYIGNLHLDEHPDYWRSFLEADVLIADYSSIIIEFFLTGKPIIYFGIPDDFAQELSYFTDQFYYVSGWDEAKHILEQLIDGVDTKKKERQGAAEKFRFEVSCSGGRILQQLINDYDKLKHNPRNF